MQSRFNLIQINEKNILIFPVLLTANYRVNSRELILRQERRLKIIIALNAISVERAATTV